MSAKPNCIGELILIQHWLKSQAMDARSHLDRIEAKVTSLGLQIERMKVVAISEPKPRAKKRRNLPTTEPK